ncbi:amidase [Actinocorallia longicatena]|uniref:Amidase family protein n=1 Tax=Actinocorallia longicatena TaxID=111803 RepID=A0ABP6QN81_9ACTN
MDLHEYAALDAVGLRELIVSRQVSAAEVEDVARRALGRADEELNALTMPPFETALDHDPDGPLGGVPFLIKDSGPFARGVPFTFGSRGVLGAVAAEDHDLMRRFRAAGLAGLGQTTAPELGLNFTTESVRYGPTRNPWALGRSPGGSSGGSAALVAAGAVPIAHGNDGGGSIRIPASCCGLVGLKPSRGRTPSGPFAGEVGFGQTVEFALTRTVRDAAHLLDAVSATPIGDKSVAPRPLRPYVRELTAGPERLRVAVTTASWSGTSVDPQVAEVTADAGRVLEWMGHTVTEAAPPFDPGDLVEGLVLGAYAAGAAFLLLPFPIATERWEAVSRSVFAESAAATLLDVARALDAQNRVTRTAAAFLTAHDLLLTPTIGHLPAPLGSFAYDSPSTIRDWLRRLFDYGPFTAPFNISGHPAISLPLGQSREGLPIGVQLVAAHGREDLLLRTAAHLEQAVPWSGRGPSVLTDRPGSRSSDRRPGVSPRDAG